LQVDFDGISVYRETCLSEQNQGPVDVANTKNPYVFVFPVSCVRSAEWDVIHTPDEADDQIGHAHSSIVHESVDMNRQEKVSKAEKIKLRESIAASSTLVVQPADDA
jgi:hypothetical protein